MPGSARSGSARSGSATRVIVAGSGGFVSTPGRWGVLRPGGILRYALERTAAMRPRVCLVMTASGDSPAYLAATYSALADLGCDVDHLALFDQPNRPVEEALGRADLVWVGGGSVANLLALWAVHDVGPAMRDAWERGVVLAGVSAGAICWHVGGPTDSFGPQLRAVTNGLGFLPFGAGVHYDSEQQRRPLLNELVGHGTLPMSYATDDGIAIVYEGTEAVAVISDTADTADMPDSAKAAYRVQRTSGGVAEETRLPLGVIR